MCFLGSFVDSLKVSGKFMDAFENKADDYVNIQLYDASTFKDSTIYKEVPRYVTNTLDKKTLLLPLKILKQVNIT